VIRSDLDARGVERRAGRMDQDRAAWG
jgi:hypothetical protein